MSNRKMQFGYVVDALVCSVLFSLIYLPDPSIVAGSVFSWDRFYHWDHFMIAQALAHQQGFALSLDVYSPYGLGWPTLLSSISNLWPLSHQNVIAFSSVFCGIYVVSVYLLFRVMVARWSLALAGTLFFLWLGFFSPLFAEMGTGLSNWQWPSMLSLRSPFDAAFFLALLIHARTGRPVVSVAAAALAGLGLYFETETGLMLVGTFILYWVCALVFGLGAGEERAVDVESTVALRQPSATLVASAFVFILVLAIGLWLASHGRALSEPAAILSGWLGGLANAASVSSLLFTRFVANQPQHLFFALGSMAVCLFAVSETAMKALHRRLDPISLFSGCVGFYGAGRLLLFVWNSEAIRIRLVGLSIAILLTLEIKRYIDSLCDEPRGDPDRRNPWISRLLPGLTLLAVVGLLVSSPTFADYPNRWNRAQTSETARGTYLIPSRQEILLKNRRDRWIIRPLQVAVERVRLLTAEGERVAVLDPFKTYIYLEAGARPWTGDAALFMNTWTRAASTALVERFLATGPRYVLIRRSPIDNGLTLDTWTQLREALRSRYRVVEELPIFDLLFCETCSARG